MTGVQTCALPIYFADFDAAASRELGRLALQCQVSCLFVHDQLEEAMPARGAYPISDGEGVALMDADRPAERAAYAKRFAERRAAIEGLARQRGIAFVPLQTGCDLEEVLRPERMNRVGRAGAGRPAA